MVAGAVRPDAATLADVRPALEAITTLPKQTVDDADALGIAHGRPVGASVPGERAALVKDGELLAIAERSGAHWLPRVVLFDPSNLAPSA
jgi:hypothetical protein